MSSVRLSTFFPRRRSPAQFFSFAKTVSPPLSSFQGRCKQRDSARESKPTKVTQRRLEFKAQPQYYYYSQKMWQTFYAIFSRLRFSQKSATALCFLATAKVLRLYAREKAAAQPPVSPFEKEKRKKSGLKSIFCRKTGIPPPPPRPTDGRPVQKVKYSPFLNRFSTLETFSHSIDLEGRGSVRGTGLKGPIGTM